MGPTAGRARGISCRAVFLIWVFLDLAMSFVAPSTPGGPIMSRAAGSTAEDEVKQYPPLPTSVKGILFDMDGTLTDSDTLHFEAYRGTNAGV